MADIIAADLTREQIALLNATITTLGEPADENDIPGIIQVLDIAKLWYLKRREAIRGEDGKFKR